MVIAKVSGAKSDRPGLADALEFARSGDALVIWKLDRLFMFSRATAIEKRAAILHAAPNGNGLTVLIEFTRYRT